MATDGKATEIGKGAAGPWNPGHPASQPGWYRPQNLGTNPESGFSDLADYGRPRHSLIEAMFTVDLANQIVYSKGHLANESARKAKELALWHDQL
jgi:hypothetical protein